MADSEKAPEETAPAAPAVSAPARRPGFFERRRRQARLRERIAVREQLLLELGAIVYELHRQGQRAPELLQARAAQLDEVDAEVRAMQASTDAADTALAPDWQPQDPATGEWQGAWDGQQTGEWDAGTEPEGHGDWADQGDEDWDGGETREWRPEDEWEDEEGEWGDDPDADLGETQEWSANGDHVPDEQADTREERP